MKRCFLMVLLLLFSISMFAAGKNVVTIWSWRSQDQEVWQKVERILNEKGIDVKINFRAFIPTEYDSKMLIALQSGTGPDIVYSRRLPGGRTKKLIDAGLLLPITSKIDFSHFSQSVLNFIKDGDEIYGVPFAVQVVGIFYNKDMYDKYGLKEPQTWSELVENAKVLKKHGITPFFIPGKEAWALAMQHAMCGVSVLGPEWIEKLEKGETDFLDPKWIDLNRRLNDLKQFYQDGFLANSTNDMNAAFAFGQAAMVFYGIWGLQQWRELNPDINVGYFMVPPVTKDQKPYAYVYMDGALALTSNSKNPDLALEVLKFAATPEFGTIFSNVTFNIPGMMGANTPEDPLFREVVEVAEKHASPKVYWVGSVFVTQKPSLYDDVLAPGMQEMYAGKITPEEFAKKAQDALSQWYEPLRKRLGK